MFGEVLKAAAALKSRIGEQVGLCLEDEASAGEYLEAPCQQPTGKVPSVVRASPPATQRAQLSVSCFQCRCLRTPGLVLRRPC